MFCSTKAALDTNHGLIIQAALSQHSQISEMFMIGSIDVEIIQCSMDLFSKIHKDIRPLLEQCLVKTVFKAFRQQKNR